MAISRISAANWQMMRKELAASVEDLWVDNHQNDAQHLWRDVDQAAADELDSSNTLTQNQVQVLPMYELVQ